MGPRGRSPLTEAALGAKKRADKSAYRQVVGTGEPYAAARVFQLSATGPSVSKSIPSGLALQITRIACHAAALKGVPTKYLCRINHPHLPTGPPQLRITVAQADGSAVHAGERPGRRSRPFPYARRAAEENEQPRALGRSFAAATPAEWSLSPPDSGKRRGTCCLAGPELGQAQVEYIDGDDRNEGRPHATEMGPPCPQAAVQHTRPAGRRARGGW